VAAARPPAGASDAESKTLPAQGSPAAVQLARKHFKKALERYRKGKYREAIEELNQAIALDPHGKDLVYNRGLVYEKLGQIDDAIREFHHYMRMEQDPAERQRARAILRRLEGARREVETPADASASGRQSPEGPESTKSPDAGSSQKTGSSTPGHRGRLDTWVYVAGGVAAAAVVVGSIFGIRALATEPGVDQSTGGSRSYSRMQDDQSRAHSYAVVADVSFAVGILSGAAAGALYFMRAPAPARADVSRSMPALPPSAVPAPGFSWGMRF
jgi:tetratricopeptide (TPR) repeat protein